MRHRVLACACVSALLAVGAPVGAQTSPAEESNSEVDASPKGAVGLGLIGAEIGLVVPALAGLHKTWSMIVFPAVGAAGGAVAGHFLIDDNDHTSAAVALLAGGMALIVPSLVVTITTTSYHPDDEAEPEPNDDEPGSRVIARQTESRSRTESAMGSTGLVRLRPGSVAVAVPALGLVPAYSAEEQRRYGLRQQTELRVPVLSAVF